MLEKLFCYIILRYIKNEDYGTAISKELVTSFKQLISVGPQTVFAISWEH